MQIVASVLNIFQENSCGEKVPTVSFLKRVVTVGMEIEHNNKWVCMEKTDDNYFSINGLGEIKFPKRFRLTSISGEQLVSTVPGIANNENIATDIQYSDFNPGEKSNC